MLSVDQIKGSRGHKIPYLLLHYGEEEEEEEEEQWKEMEKA